MEPIVLLALFAGVCSIALAGLLTAIRPALWRLWWWPTVAGLLAGGLTMVLRYRWLQGSLPAGVSIGDEWDGAFFFGLGVAGIAASMAAIAVWPSRGRRS